MLSDVVRGSRFSFVESGALVCGFVRRQLVLDFRSTLLTWVTAVSSAVTANRIPPLPPDPRRRRYPHVKQLPVCTFASDESVLASKRVASRNRVGNVGESERFRIGSLLPCLLVFTVAPVARKLWDKIVIACDVPVRVVGKLVVWVSLMPL